WSRRSLNVDRGAHAPRMSFLAPRRKASSRSNAEGRSRAAKGKFAMAKVPSPAREARALPDAPLQFGKFLGEFAICLKRLTQFHKCAHDRYVHLYCALAVQHAREHRDALLSEGIGQMSSAAPT